MQNNGKRKGSIDYMKKKFQTEFSQRQHMLLKDFELYYYSDTKLEPVTSHRHDCYEFYFFMEGDIEICVDKMPYKLQHGDVLLLPPGTEHYPKFLSWKEPYRRFVLWVSIDYCNALIEQSTDYGYLMQHVMLHKEYIFHNDKIAFNTITSLLFRLIQEMRGERFGKQTEIALQLNTLILYLNRVIYERKNKKNLQGEREIYFNLCDFIEDHLEEDLSLERLSKEFFVSKYYISHTFKDNIGISIHQYISKKRLNVCKDAILGNESIGKVCQQYGFADYSSFYRAFKKEYGISPKDYKDMRLLPGEKSGEKQTVVLEN